jgi:hypothetical protein
MAEIASRLHVRGSIHNTDGYDLTENMNVLLTKHYKKTTEFHEYHHPNDTTVGVNNSKGKLIEIC